MKTADEQWMENMIWLGSLFYIVLEANHSNLSKIILENSWEEIVGKIKWKLYIFWNKDWIKYLEKF